MRKQNGIFLFNIIPIYRPGISDVFDSVKLASLPSTAQRIKQNTFFGTLENICGQCLNEADLLYVFATNGDRDFAKINWKSPGNFTLTEVNTPTFTPDVGFSGDGSTSYLNTGWDPTNNGVNYTLDECGAFCYVNNEISITASSEFAFGCGEGAFAQGMCLAPKLNSGRHGFQLNANTINTEGTAVSSIGFFHIRRVADNDSRIFKNGSQAGTTQTTASSGMTDSDLILLANNIIGPFGFTDSQIGIFGIGSSFAGQESALYTAWNTYFTSL